jgi:hypothetical protein
MESDILIVKATQDSRCGREHLFRFVSDERDRIQMIEFRKSLPVASPYPSPHDLDLIYRHIEIWTSLTSLWPHLVTHYPPKFLKKVILLVATVFSKAFPRSRA